MTAVRGSTVALVLGISGCGDRAPPALWPEPPPPTLAEPIGVATDGATEDAAPRPPEPDAASEREGASDGAQSRGAEGAAKTGTDSGEESPEPPTTGDAPKADPTPR